MALLDDIITRMATFALSEMGGLPSGSGDYTLQATHSQTPDEITTSLPVMLFASGEGGVDYNKYTLAGGTIGAVVPGTDLWEFHIIGVVLVARPQDPSQLGAIEAAARQWYSKVPTAFAKHHTLAQGGVGLVTQLRVGKGWPTLFKLSSGDPYMGVGFDFYVQAIQSLTYSP